MSIVGEALALGVTVSQLFFIFPAAAVEHQIDVRAIGTLGIAKNPQRRLLQIATVLLLVLQHMLANIVLFAVFIRRRGQPRGFCQQLGLHREQIAEDPRQSDQHVYPRPAQLLKR